MPEAVSRLQFLRGDFQGVHTPVRPPWAWPDATFTRRCERCDACRKACPDGIVTEGRGGYPAVSFERHECTFCGACVRACPSGALAFVEPDGTARRPWTLMARVSTSCLSRRAITCRVCGDVCDPRALVFELAVGGVATPRVDAALCTGCGACVAPCPVDAIEVR